MDQTRRHLVKCGVKAEGLRHLVDEPNPIYLFEVRGHAALDAWDSLHAVADDVGHSPVILGGVDNLRRLNDNLIVAQGMPNETVEYSLKLDARRWFEKRREMDPDIYAAAPGDWRDDVGPNDTIRSVLDRRTGQPLGRVAMALAPTPASWEVPAHLRFGNWNSCPEPAVHVTIWRRWHERFGADIVAITADVVESRVARPPTTRAAALALADEQFTYCGDIVDQGVGTVAALAATLLDAPTWYFWWD